MKQKQTKFQSILALRLLIVLVYSVLTLHECNNGIHLQWRLGFPLPPDGAMSSCLLTVPVTSLPNRFINKKAKVNLSSLLGLSFSFYDYN